MWSSYSFKQNQENVVFAGFERWKGGLTLEDNPEQRRWIRWFAWKKHIFVTNRSTRSTQLAGRQRSFRRRTLQTPRTNILTPKEHRTIGRKVRGTLIGCRICKTLIINSSNTKWKHEDYSQGTIILKISTLTIKAVTRRIVSFLIVRRQAKRRAVRSKKKIIIKSEHAQITKLENFWVKSQSFEAD